MLNQTPIGVIRGPDVKTSLGILQDVDPKQTRQAGLEPATSRLTAGCSTIELLPNRPNKRLYRPA